MKIETVAINYATMRKLQEANSDGNVTCCYCGGMMFWKYSELAHFHKCRHMAIRFREENTHTSHRECNQQDELGDKQNYPKYLQKRYGKTILDELEKAKNTEKKYMDHELIELNKFCIEQIKILKKFKRL